MTACMHGKPTETGCAACERIAELERVEARAKSIEADIAPHRSRALKILGGEVRHLGKHFVAALCDEIERLQRKRDKAIARAEAAEAKLANITAIAWRYAKQYGVDGAVRAELEKGGT